VVVGLLFVLVIRYRPAGLFGDPSEVEAMGEE
jgi:branched-chain amino acid transport system permease protein